MAINKKIQNLKFTLKKRKTRSQRVKYISKNVSHARKLFLNIKIRKKLIIRKKHLSKKKKQSKIILI